MNQRIFCSPLQTGIGAKYMNIGSQMLAPDGYKNLEKGATYSFLHSDVENDRVWFVTFIDAHLAKTAKPIVLAMNRASFEEGLLSKKIILSAEQKKFPTWLSWIDGVNLQRLDADRTLSKNSLFNCVSARVALIQPLLEIVDEIMNSDNPFLLINRYARKCKPIQKESRIRRWFFTYLAFGRNFWTLVPDYFCIGQWDRMKAKEHDEFSTKRGRPSNRKGKHSGYNVDKKMIEKIKEGYLEHSGIGISMRKIYSRSITSQFGCTVTTNLKNAKSFTHPKGEPFPSPTQFSYHAKKTFGIHSISQAKYGAARYRENKFESRGSFTNNVGFINERVEADGYFVKDRPRGLIENSVLPKLCVVRSVCAASGLLSGIGFSLGGETGIAYKCMLFCMAVGKVKFCELFGIEIKEYQWPGEGLSPHNLFDRGPAGAANFTKNIGEFFHIKGLAPAFQPMSKAIIEGSHPRDVKTSGAPIYNISTMSPIMLAKREIYQLLLDNWSSDASKRLTPDMISNRIQGNPLGIWHFLDERGRTASQPIEFAEAVRKFLSPKTFTLKNDGVYLNNACCFNSNQLKATGVFGKVSSSQATKIDGYILDLCVGVDLF
jgi:hypothetical protein